MHLNGTVTIHASRQAVWDLLTDPHAASPCIPGLKSLDVIEPGRKFRVVAGIGLGSMRVTFTIDADWIEMDAPNHAVMKAHGTAPGSAADVTSEMTLSEQDDGATELAWSADVVVVGRIASLAARLLGTVAQKLTGQFFECVRRQIER